MIELLGLYPVEFCGGIERVCKETAVDSFNLLIQELPCLCRGEPVSRHEHRIPHIRRRGRKHSAATFGVECVSVLWLGVPFFKNPKQGNLIIQAIHKRMVRF
jgi:hypothetical protein